MIALSLLQEGPAETTVYMIAGYAVVFITMALYTLSLWLRWKNLQRDQNVLEDLLPKEEKPSDSSKEQSNA